MSEHVKITVDLSKGSVEVDAPVERLKEIFTEIGALVPLLSNNRHLSQPATADLDAEAKDVPSNEASKPKRQSRKRKPIAKKIGAPNAGDLGTWNYADFTPFDLGLSEKDALEVRSQYGLKSPNVGWEKALIALYFLKKYCGKELSKYDDIFQILRDGGEDKIPKNMSGEISTLVDKNFAIKEDSGIRLKVLGPEYVEKHLPKK